MRNFFFIFIVFSLVFICAPLEGAAQETTEQASSPSPEAVQEQLQEEKASQEDQRVHLEAQLAELEKQITEQQKSIEGNQKEQKTLKNEISTLTKQSDKIALQIRAIDLNLVKLGKQITETQRQINLTENKIDSHKTALSTALQTIYEADNQGVVNILLANDRFSDFFGDINNVVLVQYNLRTSLLEIEKLRQEFLEQKQELSLEKDDVSNLRSSQEKQKKSVVSIQADKSNLLKVTKGKESEYQKILKEKRETAAQIRSRIFELLGGGELTFETAYNYAKLAEQATGVRSALILAILQHESLLGKNVGRCYYHDAARNKYNMHPTRDVPIFLELMQRLGIDPLSSVAQISCPNRDGTYGGAMGPAQFIPSTWKLYEESITRVTGNSAPSPWNNSDAFVATGLYIKNSLDSSACKNYSQGELRLAERCAASQYYSGSRWRTYLPVYGDPVIQKAAKFQADIDVLNSSNGTSKVSGPGS